MPSSRRAPRVPAIPILVGSTGSGKTAVALESADRHTDILSADSRQVYKHLSAGTAKPVGEWQLDPSHPVGFYYGVDGVPHHLMDFVEPTESYNAGLFARQAEDVLAKVAVPGRKPMIVGGTGLYLRALVDGLAPLPPRDEAIRAELAARAEKDGRAALHAELARIDPVAASAIPPNNISRLVRALEVHRLTGKPLTWWHKEKTEPSKRRFRWFGLRWPKPAFAARLAERCHAMAPALLAETDALIASGLPAGAPALEALGYRSAVDCLQGRLRPAEYADELLRQTRLYVKRQLTWFNANPRIKWIDVEPPFDAMRLGHELRRRMESD